MSDFLRDPPRWKERTDQARLAERAAGNMVRTMGQAEPLSGPQLARIAARVRDHKPRSHRLRLWVPAMAVLLFAGVAAASAARIDILPRWLTDIVRPRMTIPPARMPTTGAPRARSIPHTPAPAPALVPQPTSEAPVPEAIPAATPVPTPGAPSAQPAIPSPTRSAPRPLAGDSDRARIREPVAKPHQAAPAQSTAPRSSEGPRLLPTPAVLPSRPIEIVRVPVPAPQPVAAVPIPSAALPSEPMALAPATRQLAWADQPIAARPAESSRPLAAVRPVQSAPAPAPQGAGPIKSLSAAVHALRAEHAPEAALAILDRNAGELDKSSVGHEALLLRVEAMLKLERRGEVLKLLDAAPLAGVAASRTLLLTRGELRADAGRCAEAIADFDLVLVQTQGHNKRALAGRAKCQPSVHPL